MLNYYTQLARYVDVAAKTKNPEPVLAYLGLTFMAGGLMGFIGMDLADWLLDKVKDAARGTSVDSQELQKSSVRKWLIENTPDWASAGPLSAYTDLGLYGSFTTKVVDPDRSFIENVFPKTTASMDILGGLAKIPKLFMGETTQREKGKILEGIAPKFLTQAIRNKYQNKNNIVYDVSEKSPGLPVYQRTPFDQAVSEHGKGIRSLSEALASDEMYAYRKGQTQVKESTKAALLEFDKALVNSAKFGDKIPPVQMMALQKKGKELFTKWDMDENQFTRHVEEVGSSVGLPDQVIRNIVQSASGNISAKQAKQIKELSEINTRITNRKNDYSR